VAAAGGANPDADLERINLAQKLVDGDHITIYRIGEIAPTAAPAIAGTPVGQADSSPAAPTTQPETPLPAQTPRAGRPSGPSVPSGAAKPTPGVKININTAGAADLEQIPGIGPALAQRIVADREQNGPFKSVDDLARISGIKAGIIARLRDYVTTGP
jgi:competence protein ComEA